MRIMMNKRQIGLLNMRDLEEIIRSLNNKNLQGKINQLVEMNDKFRNWFSDPNERTRILKSMKAERELREFSDHFDNMTKVFTLEENPDVDEIKELLEEQVETMKMLHKHYRIKFQ